MPSYRSDEPAGARSPRWPRRRAGRGRPVRAAALLALAGALVGCASGGMGEEDRSGEPEVTIQVENNLTPAITVNVLAAPTARPLDFLGTVASRSFASFTLRTKLIPGRFRLVAERTDGRVEVSREVQIVSDGAIVNWNLELNMITVEVPEGG